MTEERRVTIEAPGIDEAITEVSRQWNVPTEKLRAQVLSESREGFLGLFGNRKLTVEVRMIEEENQPDLISRGTEFVNDVLRLMDIKAEARLSEKQTNMLDISGEDALDYVVGRYGDCIRAMEYIVNLALRDPKSEPRLKIDSCGYRDRRTKSLERLAEATARQVMKHGKPIRLDPMASWERWIVHNTLKNNSDVMTESIGEPPMRKVVIMPKIDPDNARVPGPATMRFRAQKERSERNNLNQRNNHGRRFRR